jgi:hypothetical protein
VATEEARLPARYLGDLLNFYFFILFLVAEGEVERFVCCVNVLVDESDVLDKGCQEMPVLSTPKGFTEHLYVLFLKEGDYCQGCLATGRQI